MFHIDYITLGAITVFIAMIIFKLASKDKQEGYQKVIIGLMLIIFGGIISIINNNILRLWPLSVLGLTLTTIEVILVVGGLIFALKDSKKKTKNNKE
ncbi:MAG: hypothetical protein Q7U71_02405 [bacterium]|nr:hypothetical protein [bacterium]